MKKEKEQKETLFVYIYKRAIEAFDHYWNDPDPEDEVSDA